MALLVLPHKKRQVKLNQAALFGAEKDAHNKFTTQVGRLRMLFKAVLFDSNPISIKWEGTMKMLFFCSWCKHFESEEVNYELYKNVSLP